jgi:hypothetical protein
MKRKLNLLLRTLAALLLVVAGWAAPPLRAQSPKGLSNPFGGAITAASTNCSVAQSCVWMQLPPNTGSVSVTTGGVFSQTLTVEESPDGGNTWTSPGTITTAGINVYGAVSMTDFRVRCSAFTSGLATINLQASTAGTNGAANVPGAPISNGQWVTAGQVIWFQYTTQAIGTITMNQDVKIMQQNGAFNLQNWSVSCNLNAIGGFGTGYSVPVSGWLQSATTYASTGGFPQGSMYVNIYALNSMPTGGGTGGCVSTLAAANIGTLLFGAPTGSSYPVSFVGTSSIPVSPWSIPGYTNIQNVTTPSAGAEWTFTPAGTGSGGSSAGRVCVQAVTFELVTSATVANRTVALRIFQSGGIPQAIWIAQIPQTASQSIFYSFTPGASDIEATLNGGTFQTVPFNNGNPICFNQGATQNMTIGTSTGGLQAGDQYSNISMFTAVQQDNN